MERSLKVVAIVNIAFFLVMLMQWRFQLRLPDPLKFIGLAIVPIILLTWGYLAVGLAVLWSVGERIDAAWLYVWVVISGAFTVWFLISLIRFLFT